MKRILFLSFMALGIFEASASNYATFYQNCVNNCQAKNANLNNFSAVGSSGAVINCPSTCKLQWSQMAGGFYSNLPVASNPANLVNN